MELGSWSGVRVGPELSGVERPSGAGVLVRPPPSSLRAGGVLCSGVTGVREGPSVAASGPTRVPNGSNAGDGVRGEGEESPPGCCEGDGVWLGAVLVGVGVGVGELVEDGPESREVDPSPDDVLDVLDGLEVDEDGEELDDGVELDDEGELVELDGEFDVEDGEVLLFDEPASLLPEPGSSAPPLRPAAFSRPLRACRPAREPTPSRNDSVNVCPEFFTASLNSSAPAFPVRPRS
ncbi:hypothetical protein [Kitasatospora sp. NPDC004289]